ncbi:DUF3168 domain-containing protein [Polaromonas jejuensis]|uniref:DUF3168 domain-containing protein n=1 Tax=Polaromonas jejuensis TaxID=457502 RepID=A0ABW0QIJ8_9BURK|nr:DUF3168 domain-containing protein [Polaromonas jejuensis]
MTIQQQLVTLLSGFTDVGTRVYPPAPEQPARPYITFQRISANSENVLSGSSGLTNTRMQIDVYADTYVQAQTIAGQVDALMAGWVVPNVSQPAQDLYEDPVKLHRVSLDYSIWHS